MVQVIALKNHVYNGRKRNKGDVYEAQAAHLRILKALGAEPYVEPKKVVVAVAQDQATPVTPTPTRQYKRRDMKAE